MIKSETYAQNTDVRVSLGLLQADGTLVLHITAPRGQSIEAASLILDDMTYPLYPSPESLPITQWFVIDARITSDHYDPALREQILRLAEPNANEIDNGIIWYGSEAMVDGPTAVTSAFTALLDQHWDAPVTGVCITSALEQLSKIPVDEFKARRVAVLAGELDSQPVGCIPTFDLISKLASPIDLIVIDADVNDTYLDLVEGTGGNVWWADTDSIVTRMNELHTLWNHPVYLLTGEMAERPAARKGQVTVTLSRGETVTVPVIMQLPDRMQLTGIMTPIPSPTLTATVTATDLLTPLPTAIDATPLPTDALVLTESGMLAASHTPVNTAAYGPTVEGGDATNTAFSTAPTSLADTGETTADNSFLLVGIIGGGTLLIVLLLRVSWRRKSQQRAQVARPLFEETIFVPKKNIQHDVITPLAADPPVMSTLPLATMQEDEELLITQLEDTGPVIPATAQSEQPAGWLRLVQQSNAPAIRIPATGIQLGRRPGADIRISSDSLVSGHHARIDRRDNGSVWITVLSKTNPVLINKVAITTGQSYELTSGDIVHLSPNTSFEFFTQFHPGFNEEVDPPWTI